MKHYVIILISACMLSLSACSDDNKFVEFDKLKIELNSDGYIVSPKWMKELVDKDSLNWIRTFNGVYVDGKPYITLTGFLFYSYAPYDNPIFTVSGEKLEYESDEYRKVIEALTDAKPEVIWERPTK